MRLPLLAVSMAAVLGSSSCASQYVAMIHGSETEKNHYVLVRAKSGGQFVYDCYSKPDGTAWKPTCREVTMEER